MFPRQTTAPADERLHEKLGIENDSKILVLAGCMGDWANALAERAIVRYTDSSKEMTDYVKARFPSTRIAQFSTTDALKWPIENYDWVFFFEPIPLQGKALAISLLRALAKAKGAKIVFSNVNLGAEPETMTDVERICEIYGARLNVRKEDITCRYGERYDEYREVGHSITTLFATPESRKKAELDLKLIWLLQGRKAVGLKELLSNPEVKRLKARRKEVVRALERINLFSAALVLPGHAIYNREVEVSK